jgi:acetolactate synthase-1/2/3 large subunit
MARERLNIVTVIFNNGAYGILNLELERTGAGNAGPRAKSLLDLTNPALDFTEMAQGMGVPATRTETAESFASALERALATPGPHLIEAIVPPAISGLKLKALPYLLRALGRLPGPLARAVKRKVAP